jgi:CRISPR-associated exonuclease Cas4
MMGDRDYRELIKNAVRSIGKDLEIQIDPKDIKIINLHEVVRCLRRSFFDRTEPKEYQRTGFNELLSGLLQKMHYGSKPGDFDIEGIKLRGQPDMIIDDAVLIFRPASQVPEIPHASDVLYLNACMWIFNKVDGIIIYITGDRKEVSFSLSKDKKMFEEVIRRVRVLNNLLSENKTPILEPSQECSSCQYYERCFINQKLGRSVSLGDLLGLKKD